MVTVSNREEIILIEIDGKFEELDIKQAGKLKSDLYKAIGISFAFKDIKKGQQALKDIQEGKVPDKGQRWSDFQRERSKEIENENLEKLKEGSKVVLK